MNTLATSIIQKKVKTEFFGAETINTEDPRCNSSQYFREICSIIDLSEIYKFLGTCYYDDSMPCCPILLEIGPEKIQKSYGNCKYLLQAWDKDKKKVLNRPLKSPIRAWAVCYRYMIYTLLDSNDGSDDHQYAYIVDFEQNNATVKLKDFGQDPAIKFLLYHDQFAYAATEKEIFVTQVVKDKFNNGGCTIEYSSLKNRTIPSGEEIKGLFMNTFASKNSYIFALHETKENLLDFNQLYIYNYHQENYRYEWKQWREVEPRAPNYQTDPITKVCLVLCADWLYALSLRTSGNVDIYWNGLLKDSTTDQCVEGIEMTSTTFFFRMSDGRYLSFDHKGAYAINFGIAMPIQDEDFDWTQIKMKQVHDVVNIYTGMKIFTMGRKTELKSLIALSHDKFVSIFNITDWKWVNHEDFQDEFQMLFMHNNKKKNLNYTAGLTKKGWCHIGVMYNGGMRQDTITEAMSQHKSGKVIRACEDTINQESLMILHENPKDPKLKALSIVYQQAIARHDDYVLAGKERVGIAYIKLQGSKLAYSVIQNDSQINLYVMSEKEDIFKPQLLKQIPEFKDITGTIHSGCSYDITDHIFLFDEKNMYMLKFETMKLTTFANVFITGIYVVNKSVTYALAKENKEAKNPGMRIFSMESIIKKGTLKMMLLKNQDIGCFGEFEYNENLMRFGMIRSFSNIYVMPILHCNTNRFMDSAYPNDYIAYKTVGTKEITLMDNGCLSSWNVITGKKLSRKILPEHNYTEYTLKGRKACPILLVSNNNVPEKQEDAQYFQPYLFETRMENQMVNLKTMTFSYKRYKLIDIKNENEVEVALEFIRPTFNFQLIFINKQKDRMIEILTNQRAFIYKRKTLEGNVVEWEYIKKIPEYSQEIQSNNDTLEQFTPCFSRYLVLDKKNCQFLIKDTYTNQLLFRVPKDLMELEDVSKPRFTMNRMRFVDYKSMIIVNLEGVEKIIDIDNDFNELSYNFRPLFLEVDPTNKREFEDFQYYIRRRDYFTYDTLVRLKRTYQDYKTAYFLLQKPNEELIKTQVSVDPHKFSFNSSSFTFLHWSLIEQIASGKLKAADLDDDVIEVILYNILPGGKTALHMLADMESELIGLFQASHPDFEVDTPKYHVPFVPDYQGKTAIHKCIEKLDYKSIDTMLKYLKFYPVDHHSRGIKNLFSELIDKQVTELPSYLESRFQQTTQMKKITKGCLKEGILGIDTSGLWVDINIFKGKFMRDKPVEDRIRIEIIDFPQIYHYDEKEFSQIFTALSKTDKLDFFELRSIQKLIDFNFPLVRRYIIRKLFIPFCLFQLFFFILTNYCFEAMARPTTDNTISQLAFFPVSFFVLGFASYFLKNELNQLSNEGIDYLLSFWNYIDLIPPIGIFVMAILIIVSQLVYAIPATVLRAVLSIITFFMWFKILYFMRIFKNTGYLIRMIFEVVADMRNFFLVLLITIAAFGDSFLRLSLGNEGEEIYTTDFLDSIIYTYRMILGDFGLDFGTTAPGLALFIFILCTVFNMIVMLNLLIAIISDSYARVTNMSNQTTYQERSIMISENQYLIPDDVRANYAERGQYLIVVTNLDDEEQESLDPFIVKLNEVQESLRLKIKETHKDLEKQINDKHQEKDEAQKKDQAKMAHLYSALFCQQEKAETIICPNPLRRTFYYLLKMIDPANYSAGWFCDGKNISCIMKRKGFNNDEKDIVYHCAKCNYDYCEGCYDFYGNDHEHPMDRMTFQELKASNSAYGSWGCDARYKTNNKCLQKSITDEFTPLYHDDITGMDLCEGCAKLYAKKPKKVIEIKPVEKIEEKEEEKKDASPAKQSSDDQPPKSPEKSPEKSGTE